MSSHGTFSLQLVNQVIDELGNGYHEDRAMFPNFARRGKDYATLCACSLVSKRWSSRSRTHIFKTVRIHGDKDQPTITPPPSILPYVKDLEIHYDYDGQESANKTSLQGFLKAFATSPIERLKITSGTLANQRICIREFIDVNFTTLRTVEFNICSLSPQNISDILLEPHRIQSLHLVDAGEWAPPRGNQSLDVETPRPCSKPSEVELSISGGDPLEGPVGIARMAAQLPCRFRKLDIEHVAAGEGAPEATNALLKANADALSSLCVRVWAEDMEVEVEPEHLFSLKHCSNLSELTLDMNHSESCAVRDSTHILSTLDPTRTGHLEAITLETRYADRWFNEDGPNVNGAKYESEDEGEGEDDEDEKDRGATWQGLDAVLSKLADTSTSMRGKRLMFTLVVFERQGADWLARVVKEWLPQLLHRFNELGLLRVHCGR